MSTEQTDDRECDELFTCNCCGSSFSINYFKQQIEYKRQNDYKDSKIVEDDENICDVCWT